MSQFEITYALVIPRLPSILHCMEQEVLYKYMTTGNSLCLFWWLALVLFIVCCVLIHITTRI